MNIISRARKNNLKTYILEVNMSKKKKAKIFSPRTDLALEACERLDINEDSAVEGVMVKTRENGGTIITSVEIINEEGARVCGKPIGKYITVEDRALRTNDPETKERIIEETAISLKEFMKKYKPRKVLVAGLGNGSITPDALGPKAAAGVIVTRHLKNTLPKTIRDKVSSVSAITPGVMGITGIETAEVLSGTAERAKPDLIVVIDALAAGKFSRLNTVIQMTDGGISPGAGVGNKRAEINKKTMGVPVIAIGVPTVVDAATLVNDTMDRILSEVNAAGAEAGVFNGLEPGERYALINEMLTPYAENMFVTPKEVDAVIDRLALIISTALNMALHPGLDRKDIELFV